MPIIPIAVVAGGVLAAGAGFKLFTGAVEDLSDATLKFSGAALAVGGLYLAAKHMKVI